MTKLVNGLAEAAPIEASREEQMNSPNSTRKEKVRHELMEMLVLFLYLGLFFCALTTYDMLLLREYHVESWDYAFAIINALVITKVIMIGEYAKVGKRLEDKALFVSAVWKAFIFALLVFAFQVVEDVVKQLIHGSSMADASHQIHFGRLASRSIVVFCAFIPLFALMGDEEFKNFVLRSGASHAKD